MSVTENVSVPPLVAGRMPETDGECLADAGAFSEKRHRENRAAFGG